MELIVLLLVVLCGGVLFRYRQAIRDWLKRDGEILAVISGLVFVIFVFWGFISQNANALAALGAIGSVLVAIVVGAATIYQARAARFQLAVAQESMAEMKVERRESLRPVVVPVGQAMKKNACVEITLSNCGWGVALNGVISYWDASTRRLYHGKLGALPQGESRTVILRHYRRVGDDVALSWLSFGYTSLNKDMYSTRAVDNDGGMDLQVEHLPVASEAAAPKLD